MTNALALPLAEDREPWARQPRERERAYLAFQGFLHQEPPRSVVRLAEETGRPLQALYNWSSRWLWLERSAHFDAMLVRAEDESLRERRKEMNDRHATLARAMSGKVAERIKALRPEELSPGEVGRWMQVISMTERLALGEATERVDRQGTPDTLVQVTQEITEVDATVIGPDYFAEVLGRLHDAGVIDITEVAAGNGHAGNGSVAALPDGAPEDGVRPDPD